MKSPSGYASPRRPAASRKPVRLDLRRPVRTTDDEVEDRGHSFFWKAVGIVALLHVLALGAFMLLYRATTPPPPADFISLLPEGDIAKGTAGQQSAPKLSNATTTASATKPHTAAPPPTQPKTSTPPPPTHASTTPKLDALADKPAPVKPTPPKPKVKVDLTLADGPATDTPAKPKTTPPKPKLHVKKDLAPRPVETDDAQPAAPQTDGLSREQVAKKLGDKLQAAGVENAPNPGPSGAQHSQASPFADFYASIRDQVMGKWTSPNLTDETAVNPIVEIHVEKDGRVPAELVHLTQSSGNPVYDESAMTAARSLGYLLQPLPDGCPPDIPITFKLTR